MNHIDKNSMTDGVKILLFSNFPFSKIPDSNVVTNK